jgi:nucleotide-binding universal stress UspA family protein
MKTIIAGTDFTSCSVNAGRYAALLATKLNCKLTLFNLFEAPVMHSNSGLFGISYSSQKKESEQKALKLLNDLRKEFPKIKIEYFVTSGSFKEELENFNTKHLIEAAVMGLKTKDKISKFIYGSHGVNLAGKINAPVIIVPENYKIHKISKILLAVDNNEKLKKSPLLGLERIARQLKAIVKPLYVRTQDELLNPIQKSIALNGKDLKINIIEAIDVQDGIKKYCRDSNIDLVTIISKSHSALFNLFSESNTKKIAYITKVPVMAIHE